MTSKLESFPPDVSRKLKTYVSVGKRVLDEYRKRGAANPIKYTWH